MLETTVLDLYDAACLAGGTDRVVDTAVVALVEAGRVTVDEGGRLTGTDPVRRTPVEGAVLDAIGTRGLRTIGLVRLHAAADDRVVRLVDRLEREGLLTRGRRFRRGTAPVATRAGRQAVKRLRAEPPGWMTGSAALVAFGGPERLPDEDLRRRLFLSGRPVRGRRLPYRGPRVADADDARAWAGVYGARSVYDQGAYGGATFDGSGGGGYDGGGGGNT